MKKIDIHQVDAFTHQLFGGNPAGVVTNADALTVDEMQKIAREMNLSETAFVFQPSSDQSDIKLRFFTPTSEVKFCGHATVGALFQLAKLTMFGLGRPGENTVRVETNAGTLPMAVINHDNQTHIRFTAPELDMQPYRLQGPAFAKEFGVPVNLINENSTILLDKKLNYVYVPTSSLQSLGDQVFDFGHICEKFGHEQIIVFCFFSNETVETSSNLHARGLAPNVGVDEDPFTGSMQAGLVHAAIQNGYHDSNTWPIHTEQGHFIGRPGFAEINFDRATEQTTISADAVQVFSTSMEINS